MDGFRLMLNPSESRILQAALDLNGLHKRRPNTPGSMVLDHNQNRSLVDAQHLGIPPAGCQIERVAESVTRPDVRTVTVVKVAQCGDAYFRRERNRAACRRGRDGAIVILWWRRATRR